MEVTSLSPDAQEVLSYIRQHLTVNMDAEESRGDSYSRTSSTHMKITIKLLLDGVEIDSSSVWFSIPHPD
jgi:hypothetical protein